MSTEIREIGRRIAFYRQRRGLSQVEFGRLIQRSEAWVSQVERGIRPIKSLEVLERIAAVIEVPIAELAPSAPANEEAPPPEAMPLRQLLGSNYALHAVLASAGRPVRPTPELCSETAKAWRLAHAARYGELIPLLESLLPQLEVAVRDHESGPTALPLLARAYYACAAALAKLRQYDAAWVAADRAIGYAGQSGDSLLMAEGAFRLTLIFQGARYLDDAEHVAETASVALTGLVERAELPAMSLYGALQLQLAVVAAQRQDADRAQHFLARAREVADRCGDRNDYNTEFGPTNVAMHEVAVAVELGDAGHAIRTAERIETTALSPERRGRLLIDLARAWNQRRQAQQAVAALEAAERETPEQVHEHRHVHTLVGDLLRLDPDTPGLRELAGRMNPPVMA